MLQKAGAYCMIIGKKVLAFEVEKWIQKIQNPYDESFIELFVATTFWLSSPNYGGYFMREQYGTYNCSFSVIGYSYDELTVIQTYIDGLFSIENSPIPKYFERFDT